MKELELRKQEQLKKLGRERKKNRLEKAELDRIMEENKKKIEEQNRKMAEERLKIIEEQMKIENEKQRLKKKEEKAAKKEQAAILGKDNSRQKLSFSVKNTL